MHKSDKDFPGGVALCQSVSQLTTLVQTEITMKYILYFKKAHSAQIHASAVQQHMSKRPPYSYMAMIQFAINSRPNRRMTLREIYMWIEEHFPYFREVAKPGWKNSIRHNLSLHDMFIRETSPDVLLLWGSGSSLS
uniref:Forkhead box protein M1 n=1 Tax=Monopterus albus TaxID=43700 RepID=A0A3Q3JJD8_MONAL